MPKGRFELPRGYPHYALNVARLPVPPLRLVLRPPSRGPEPTSGLEPETCCLRNNRRTIQGRSPRFNYATISPILLPQRSSQFARVRGRWRTRWRIRRYSCSLLMMSDAAVVRAVLSPGMVGRKGIPATRTPATQRSAGRTCCRLLTLSLLPLALFPLDSLRPLLALVTVMRSIPPRLASG